MTRAQKERIILILNEHGDTYDINDETNPLVSAMDAITTEE